MRANMRFHMTHEFVLLAKTILSMYYAGRKPCQTTKCHFFDFFTDNIILYSHLFVFILILLVKIYLYKYINLYLPHVTTFNGGNKCSVVVRK